MAQTELGQRVGFTQTMHTAADDFEQALRLTPHFYASHGSLITIERAECGVTIPAPLLLKKALVACPLCTTARSAYLGFERPVWGGSPERAEALLTSWQAETEKNPRLKLLKGYVHEIRCDMFEHEKQSEAAFEECDRAVRVSALSLFDMALELDPQNKDARKRRIATTTPEVAQSAAKALEDRIATSPDDFGLHRQLDDVYLRDRRFPDIIAMWSKFLDKHPDHGLALWERAGAYHHREMPRTRSRMRATRVDWGSRRLVPWLGSDETEGDALHNFRKAFLTVLFRLTLRTQSAAATPMAESAHARLRVAPCPYCHHRLRTERMPNQRGPIWPHGGRILRADFAGALRGQRRLL